jgi:type I restriction enzyme, S subunit
MAQFETSTINQLTQNDLRNLQIPYPPTEERCEIATYLASACHDIDATLTSVRREMTLLHELRTRLVADVITGKLDVRDAAAQLPDEAPDAEPLDETDELSQDEATADDIELEAAEDV